LGELFVEEGMRRKERGGQDFVDFEGGDDVKIEWVTFYPCATSIMINASFPVRLLFKLATLFIL